MALSPQILKHLDVKSLAKFMATSPVGQRRILQEHKYPELDEVQTRLLYYREVRDRIAAYHQSQQPPSWLQDEAKHLEMLAQFSMGATRLRIENNARSLREYATHFSARKFEIMNELTLKLRYADVVITVHPNLHIKEKGKEKLIKLDFKVGEADKEQRETILSLMHEAAQQAGLAMSPSQVLYLDVSEGKEFKAKKLGVRSQKNVEATCFNLSAIWDTL